MNLNSRSAYINTESISSDMRPSTPVTSSNLSSSDESSLSLSLALPSELEPLIVAVCVQN
jgi:hypothetical protein